MAYVPMEGLIEKTGGSVYKLVILASKRAIELNQGAGKLVEANPNMKISTLALKEIAEGKVAMKQEKEE